MPLIILITSLFAASCGTFANTSDGQGQLFSATELTFVPDEGVRVSNAARPAVARAGNRWYLHYVDADSGQPLVAASSDGLVFSDQGPAPIAPPALGVTGIALPDGRRRLFAGVGGAIYSFISRDQSRTFHPERGSRLRADDFSSPEVHALADPVPVRLPDGRYRLYVVGTAGGTPIILSATTPTAVADVASPVR